MFNSKKFFFATTFLFSSILFFAYTHNTPKMSSSLLSPKYTLKNITKKSQLKHRHIPFIVHNDLKNVEKWLQAAGGASVSVIDVNNDGLQDIFLTNSRIKTNNSLYINQGDETFKEMSKKFNIQKTRSKYPTTGAIFFDCNNNGKDDLLILSARPQIYINNGIKFRLNESSIPSKTFYSLILSANVFDIDKDGDLDIILASYLSENIFNNPHTTKIMPTNFLNSKNKAPIRILKNNGQCSFSEDQQLPTKGWHFSIAFQDLNNDNNPDLWVSSDYGIDQIYINNKGKFIDYSQKLTQPKFSRNGMNTSFGYIDNNSIPYAYTSHISEAGERNSGNVLLQISENLKFKNVTKKRNVSHCGWSWASKFFDINNDSLLDIITVNGFVNGNNNKNYWYQASVLESSGKNFLEDAKNWPDFSDFSMGGNQKSCLFINKGKQFSNESGLTDLNNSLQTGRGVATIDILNTGELSIVIANNNGLAQLYRTKITNNNKWIGLNLIGTKSNRNAFGAKVQAYLKNGEVLTRQHFPINGYASQSDPRIHFGLGSKKIDYINITWPMGTITKLEEKDLKINSYQIIRE